MYETPPTPPAHARRGSRRTSRRLAPVFLLAVAAAACTERETSALGPSPALSAAAPAISIVRDPDIFCPWGCDAIAAGDSMRHMVRFADPRGGEHFLERAQWSSANVAVATVSPSGMVVGRAPGDVEIRATLGTQTARLTVTIGAAHIARVQLAAPTTTLDPRRSVQLVATAIDVLGHAVPDAPLYWFAATPSVVTVDQGGLATAVGPGDGLVMVYAEFGRYAWVSLHVNGTMNAPALPVSQVDVGGTHACSANRDGTSSCWGWNYFGELGTGSVNAEWETFATPQRVVSPVSFAQVNAGDYHSCALAGDGAAWCWGNGWAGQLGDGVPGNGSPLPVAVAGGLRFGSIAAGGDHSCAVDGSGTAYCWGSGAWGQLGTGSFSDASVPSRIAASVAVTRVYPALWHSCALAADGAPWCWGGNDMGQLGNGKISMDAGIPTPAKVMTRARFTAMDSRYSHACGVTASGETWCWGRNDMGQLGDGSHESRARPVRVATTTPFTGIATGAHHSCALATDGRAWCWGNNEWGQLGDNTLTSRTAPAPIHGDLRFLTLSAGNNVTCGTTAAGEAWCWGSSHFGMLGSGQSGWDTISPVPVRVIVKQ